MKMDRREFIGLTAAAGLSLAGSMAPLARGSDSRQVDRGYKYRHAFDVWMNDVRNESMPFDNWPYAVLDDQTVTGIIRSLDVQSEAGYTAIDIAGFWTTYGWPVDIENAVDKDRQRRINQILEAAHERKMKVICFPSGILNWGFDEIIKHNPTLASDNKHEMNPLLEEAWQWQYKVFDFVANNYAIDGFHLEAADQGRCKTQECLDKWPTAVGYYSYVTGRMADYIRQKHPNMSVMATVQSFLTWGMGFSREDKVHLVELSKSVDCLFDQGHRGTYVPEKEWPEFIRSLHCAYGTSGGIWTYPPQRWERTRWFLPYTQQTGNHLKELFAAGGRGVMYYQGPVANPSTEANIAFGGRLMTDIEKSCEDVLYETIESLYHPKSTEALQQLVRVFQRAENIYFEQWNIARIAERPINWTVADSPEKPSGASIKTPPPGELHLETIFGASPGAAIYLMEPYLDTAGRMNYKQGLVTIYKDILRIEKQFTDGGRIGRIKQGIEEAVVDINNIAMAKNENAVWNDQRVGLQF